MLSTTEANVKMTTAILCALFVVLGSAASGSALAQRHGRFVGHVGIGINLGYPVYGPWYYPFPHYQPYYAVPYYPPVVVAPSPPPVYIERGDSAAAAAPAQADWFYCADARGYYPYVKECPGGWQRVPSQPPH